jgi:hypothetical protein
MAYLDFSHPARQLDAPRGARRTVAAPFTRLEREVIELARREPPVARTKREVLITSVAAKLFGIRPKLPLADPRLETLRRFAGLAWHGRADADDLASFLSVGFSPLQAEALLAQAPPPGS